MGSLWVCSLFAECERQPKSEEMFAFGTFVIVDVGVENFALSSRARNG
jgi:hypothetical protein